MSEVAFSALREKQKPTKKLSGYDFFDALQRRRKILFFNLKGNALKNSNNKQTEKSNRYNLESAWGGGIVKWRLFLF